MRTRYFALIMGLVFLAVGVLGFVPTLRTLPGDMPPIAVDSAYGLLFGLFPVNLLHNLVHILFGLWGIFAYASHRAARSYAGVVAVSYAVLTVLGLIPAANVLWGFVPIYGHDVWLHAAIALVAAVFAVARERPAATDLGMRR